MRRLAGEHAWSGRCAAAAHRWSLRRGSIHRRSSTATHSPSTASGVAIAQRASNRRQKHRSVCSGFPCRSRPASGQPRVSDALPDASPPCEWRTRRRPAQLTPREAMARVRHKRGVFFRPSSRSIGTGQHQICLVRPFLSRKAIFFWVLWAPYHDMGRTTGVF